MNNANKICACIALCFLLALATPSGSSATTYIVDRNHASASDSNTGTMTSPWATIAKATATALAGDTVFIRTGIYEESVYFENAGNPADGHIVFSAYPGETPIIDGMNVTDANDGLVLDKAYIKLIGIEIRNWSQNGIWIVNSAFIEINDCLVHDVFFGIGVADGTHDFEFNRVTVFNFDLYGFDVSPSGGADCHDGTFNDCIAHSGRDPHQNVDGFALGHGDQHSFRFNRCMTYGVFDGFDISARNTILDRCLARDCWNGAYKLWQDDVRLVNCIGLRSGISNVELDWDDRPGTTTLVNCTFYDAETYSIWIENAADTLRMTNCIIAGGRNIGLAFEQPGIGNYRGDHNLFHNTNPFRAVAVAYTDEFTLTQMDAGAWTTFSGQDAHSLVSDDENSLFVDPGNGNLRLSENSPAVDAGTSIGAPTVDFDGNPRPSGSGVDIGAYEHQGTTGVLLGEEVPHQQICLHHAYPNPFNPITRIAYTLPTNSRITLSIFNLKGERIAVLVDDALQQAGTHTRNFNGSIFSSGFYVYRLEAGHQVEMGKMILMK